MTRDENKADITIRVGTTFREELEEIKRRRIESGIDKCKKSDRILTSLIVKHNLWKEIKEEMIEYEI